MKCYEYAILINVKKTFKNGGLQFVSEMHYKDVFVYHLMSTQMIMIRYELGIDLVMTIALNNSYVDQGSTRILDPGNSRRE